MDSERVVAAMIGSFLGFFLGILTLSLKEKLDFQKRVFLFKVAALYLAKSLKNYLHEDPNQCGGLDLKSINNYLDGSIVSEDLRRIYEQLFCIYMDWTRGFYSPTGIKISELGAAKVQLESVILAVSNQTKRGFFKSWPS